MSDDAKSSVSISRRLAVLPLRDVVVYPHMVVPLFVGRKPSILALEDAMSVGKDILLVAQRKPEVDDPEARDIYRVGTLASVLQMMKMPDNTVKVMVQGVSRARLKSLESGNFFSAEFAPVSEEGVGETKPEESEALRRSLLKQFESYVKLHKNVPPEALAGVSGLDDTGRLADTIAAHMQLALDKKQVVLETGDAIKRMEYLVGLMGSEIDMLRIERKIRGRVKTQMEKSQREYYLNEQMKAIQKELGELDDAPDEITSLEKGIKEAGMPKEAQEKAITELGKLKMMAPMSAEATVVRNYLDWLLKVPWKKQRRISGDLARAEKVLEEDHYGLEKIKERILEYLAVQKRVRSMKGPILCLVGPPGVGKTSVADQSPGQPTAPLFACRWAACATRPKYGVTGAPISGRFRARSCRTSRGPVCATRCFFSTRWTRCPWTSAATPRRRCWKCWIRNRIARSTIITWKWTSIFRE